jgi:hypothetical protein
MKLDFDVTIDRGSSIAEHLAGVRAQVPFAAALAVNRTADEALRSVKDKLPSYGFHIRDRRFVDFMFKQTVRATKARPEAEIGIHGPKASIFTKHVEGVTQTTGDPLFEPLYTPTRELRPTPSAVIPRNMYPKALRLAARRDASGVLPPKGRQSRKGLPMLQGKRGAFVIVRAGRITLYQRIGPNPRDTRPLWHYVKKITVPPRLPLERDIRAVVDAK